MMDVGIFTRNLLAAISVAYVPIVCCLRNKMPAAVCPTLSYYVRLLPIYSFVHQRWFGCAIYTVKRLTNNIFIVETERNISDPNSDTSAIRTIVPKRNLDADHVPCYGYFMGDCPTTSTLTCVAILNKRIPVLFLVVPCRNKASSLGIYMSLRRGLCFCRLRRRHQRLRCWLLLSLLIATLTST